MRIPVTTALVAALLVLTSTSVASARVALDTEITSGPANGDLVLPGPVTYTFTSNNGSATFDCSVDDAAFTPCSDGTSATYDLSPGGHVFKVRANIGGNVDASPAERIWTVRNLPCEEAGAAYQTAQAKFFTFQAKKGDKREALQRAKDAGKTKKVQRIKAQIKVLGKRVAKWRKAMAAAAAQENAVC